ncbi:uncharacterized protein KNAG_0K01210 [Huiozyma naganishii CBS 8797]|uniref:C2H2-type domain-containing protein n=1 Tax=Huiozyma naganishii (strain ATCC MYA-139 / BCRC 22969 / CBS 8797 / KCTC 17520 / NBRC 10181 / NCYC 3082 / Yp74L-3) TaxID=1071383 RepID=J7SAV3_HUIN7|nr:hypothetical protein KNAG_0K01210 [Kazachstania naganishii CBS 8797]CCK72486.1 hypothetical protein KNAG_0K01210 [Kazachstania naganishii CBS 8797]
MSSVNNSYRFDVEPLLLQSFPLAKRRVTLSMAKFDDVTAISNVKSSPPSSASISAFIELREQRNQRTALTPQRSRTFHVSKLSSYNKLGSSASKYSSSREKNPFKEYADVFTLPLDQQLNLSMDCLSDQANYTTNKSVAFDTGEICPLSAIPLENSGMFQYENNDSIEKYSSPVPDPPVQLPSQRPKKTFTCHLMDPDGGRLCGAQFAKNNKLKHHQQIVHARIKPAFSCLECIESLGAKGAKKSFSRPDALTRHVKTQHPDITPERKQEIAEYSRRNIAYLAV